MEATMRSGVLRTALAALTVMTAASAAARAAEPMVMLRVDVSEAGGDHPKVKVTVPLSLIEVVIDAVDPSMVMKEIKTEKGLDLAKLWRQLRSADVDEFISIDHDGDKVKVYKDRTNFRVTIQESGYDEPNIEVRLPFAVMDYLLDERREEYKLSELVEALRASLPLTLVEARHDGDSVKVWLEER